MMKTYAGAASFVAALSLGIAAHAALAAGPGGPSGLSADSPVMPIQGQRDSGGGVGGGGGFSGGGGAGRSGGGGGVTPGGGSGGGGGGAINRGSGGGERGGFVNRGGSGAGDGGSARRGGGDRDRVIGSGRGRWEDRGDRRGRHRYTRHRGGVGIYVGPGYDYYYGDYDDSCEWLRRRAIRTGSSYWWRRFRECVY